MANSHKAKTLSLVEGSIKRGDTIEAWTFEVTGIPSPDDAVFTFSAHLENLDSSPLIELASGSGGAISVSVEDDTIAGTVPRINAPAVGKIVWELQARVPTLPVAAPANGKWNRTLFEGSFVVVQDGAERTLP